MPRSNLTYLLTHPGVVAALSVDDAAAADPQTIAAESEFAGSSLWRNAAMDAARLLLRSDERTVSIVLGEHSILAKREGPRALVAVFPTGHIVAKSIRRMLAHAWAGGPKNPRAFVVKVPFPGKVVAP